MLSDKWLSRYGLQENSLTGMERHRTGKCSTTVSTIALCTSCSQAKNAYFHLFSIVLTHKNFAKHIALYPAEVLHMQIVSKQCHCLIIC